MTLVAAAWPRLMPRSKLLRAESSSVDRSAGVPAGSVSAPVAAPRCERQQQQQVRACSRGAQGLQVCMLTT